MANSRYSPTERYVAAKRILVYGETIISVAKDLNIDRNTVRKWVHRLEANPQIQQLKMEQRIGVLEAHLKLLAREEAACKKEISQLQRKIIRNARI